MKLNEQEKKIKKFRTYFANNLVVIKDARLFKVLFKLVSLQMKEYNQALKKELPTDNITFQYSLNELRLDLQMGKSTIIKKLQMLENKDLLTITRTSSKTTGNEKNTYQINITKLEEIEDTLNKMKRVERIEFINNLFEEKTAKGLDKLASKIIEEEPVTSETEILPTEPITSNKDLIIKVDEVEEKIENLKTKYVAEQATTTKECVEIKMKEQMKEQPIIKKKYTPNNFDNVNFLHQDEALYNHFVNDILTRNKTKEQIQDWINSKIEYIDSDEYERIMTYNIKENPFDNIMNDEEYEGDPELNELINSFPISSNNYMEMGQTIF